MAHYVDGSRREEKFTGVTPHCPTNYGLLDRWRLIQNQLGDDDFVSVKIIIRNLVGDALHASVFFLM